MLIEQKPTFEPITITLTNRVEAEQFWAIVLEAEKTLPKPAKTLAIGISDWFTNHFQ